MTEEHASASNGSPGRARTIVITGGTSGIGFAAAEAILRSGIGPWHVVVANRDPARAHAAVARFVIAAALVTRSRRCRWTSLRSHRSGRSPPS